MTEKARVEQYLTQIIWKTLQWSYARLFLEKVKTLVQVLFIYYLLIDYLF